MKQWRDVVISNEVRKSVSGAASTIAAAAVLVAVLLAPGTVFAGKKKTEAPKPEPSILEKLDYSKIVWPNPPAITRIRYMDFFAGEKTELTPQGKQKSGGWMDRLAGVDNSPTSKDAPASKYKLWSPYGMAVDSKGKIYVADPRVGAIFVFNAEKKDDVQMIKNGKDAKFGLVIGLAVDDGDRLFASDSQLHHVLVFDKNRKLEASISEGLSDPAGVAVDNENRFLYVADVGNDQIMVYDADTLRLLRKIGTAGKKHELTDEGNFSKPTNVAVDSDGNLYVTDTLNARVEEFDADGNFIRAFGKRGDGPGYFAMPKGIAVDVDNHVWVADSMQNRVQVFTPEGRLLIWMGAGGLLPGQFSAVTGLAIDKDNRVFTSEQMVGRVQMFRYITQDEAKAEKAKRDAELAKKAGGAKETAQAKTPADAKAQDSTAKKP